jgi:hypothetical protein
MDAEEEDDEDEFTGLTVVEKKAGGYDCPEFILSEKEETRIQRPWRQGLIVKLMGRRIGYKALETRLKQIWVRKGVINIIDLGFEYFLVYFTNEEDYTKALEDGPWLIYDHYLIAREWTPNFHPNNATIEKAAVWVRISGLPIGYYDAKILHYIGNRIGKTVKVDRNTLYQARGKYARVCVEVDLKNPLLAMFELKNEVYKVEYEGLHMLCRTCGKFGHYIEGCPEKKHANVNQTVNDHAQVVVNRGAPSNSSVDKSAEDGPWVVVQKPRRTRQTKEGTNKETRATGAAGNSGTGTRFEILDSINEDPEFEVTDNMERNSSNPPMNNIPNQAQPHEKRRGKHAKNMGDKKGKEADERAVHESVQRNIPKVNTAGPHTETNEQQIKGNKGELTGGDNQGIAEIQRSIKETNNQSVIMRQDPHYDSAAISGANVSRTGPHHTPRPPEMSQPDRNIDYITNGPNTQVEETQAQPTGDEVMEIVQETPNLDQEEGGAKSMILA